MNPTTFDSVARLLAGRRLSRRQALAQGSASLAAAGLAAGLSGVASAQGATPTSQDATPTATGAADSSTHPTFMFVQSFQSGTFAPKAGSSDAFTLTLDQGLGQTVYFSDRPERVFGTAPTANFLAKFPFGPVNPPNAALVLEAGPGNTDVVVMELTSPAYDAASHTATYDAKVLSDYEKLGATFQETPKGAGELQAKFGAASLFIDNCPDGAVDCCEGEGYLDNFGTCIYDAVKDHIQPVGTCWNWSLFECIYCLSLDYQTAYCNNGHVPGCTGGCVATAADWKI